MLDDCDSDAREFDTPDLGSRVYRNYLETCRRLGINPVPRERAEGLIAEWSAGAPRVASP